MSSRPTTVLLIGASQRAMVQSALKAGKIPIACDLFADWDGERSLSESATLGGRMLKIKSFDSLARFSIPPADVAILSGGSERNPILRDRVATEIGLAGPSPPTLTRLDQHSHTLACLDDAGFDTPPRQAWSQAIDLDGDWLVKPESSCGGQGIHHWQGARPVDGRQYLQQRVEGRSHSAIFVSTLGKSSQLLGVTEQLVGRDWAHASEFAWCGSISAEPISSSVERTLLRIGTFLTETFSLLGVWGIDFLLDGHNPIIVDVNARITGSAELFDRMLSPTRYRSVIGLHLAACRATGRLELPKPDSGIVECKAILYQPSGEGLTISNSLFGWLKLQFRAEFFDAHETGCSIADVPQVNSIIQPAHPILTIRMRRMRSQLDAPETALTEYANRVYRACQQLGS